MKTRWILAVLAACAIALAGCKIVSEPDSVAVESVTLNVTTLTLAPGDTRKLTATVKPDNADDKTVAWSSSNADIATVDSSGTVGAIKTGTATITAQVGGKQVTCIVTVKPNPIAVENVTLDATELMLAPGDTRKLTATINPDNADDKTVTWSSSDTTVAMVGSDGTVGAIKTGTTTITAQAGDKTAICVVTVNDAVVVNPNIPVVNPDSPVAVDSITLSTTTLTIEPGKTRTLTATVTPNNADDKAVTWSSSNMSVATVNEDGIVTAHTEGTATITAQAGGKEATCTVAVKPILIAVKSVTLNMTTLTFTRGDTRKLAATVMPSNADDTTVAWASSNSDVATVGNDGTVTAVRTGTATITAQAGDITAECTVIVNPILVESVTLDKTTLTLAPGMTGKLTATVNPDNADDKTVKWSSSNTSVAMVDNNGTIGAINTGKTTVTVQAGGKTAVCEVIVHTDHSYSGGKCTLCGAKPYMENGTIDDNGVLTKYSGNEMNVVIPKGVTGIGDKVFEYRSNLTSVTIPNSVTSIGFMAFERCESLTSVDIPGSVTSIGQCAFNWCTGLTSVTIPGSVTSIGDSAFDGCTSLKNVTINKGVLHIKDSAFGYCPSLESVVIPSSVVNIERGAFGACKKINNVQYDGTRAEWDKISIHIDSGLSGKTITGKDGSTWIAE